ncbi:MAG: hypothetical protein LBU82_03265 [Treponema sp.]|jgi:hypothetical protein|nr:hypothetical protein [Treponema sp.]
MKKLVIIAVCIAVMSGVLYAQELKFDGYINSGLGIAANDNEDSDPYVKAFGVDSESNGFRFRLNGAYTNEAKNAGARFRLQAQRRLDQAGYLSVPYLYGWAGFFENKLSVTGGLVDDGTWASADWWVNDDTGEGLGLLLKAEPVKGLSLGAGAYTISQQSGGSNNMLQYNTPSDSDGKTTASLPNFGNILLKPEDMKYTINAAYTLPDLFRLGAIYRTQNKAGWTGTRNDDDYTYGGNEESQMLQAEFRLLAVKNLTAVMVGKFDKLEAFEKRGNITLSETFGYRIDKLNFGLNAVQFLYNRTDSSDKKVDYNPGLLFNPWVSYSIDKIVPRLDLVYFMGGRSKTGYIPAPTSSNPNAINGLENQWERRGFVNVAKATDAKDNYSVFSARPSVKINIDGKTFLEIGDMINYDMASKDGAYKDSKDANKNDLFTNVFYIDVKCSF